MVPAEAGVSEGMAANARQRLLQTVLAAELSPAKAAQALALGSAEGVVAWAELTDAERRRLPVTDDALDRGLAEGAGFLERDAFPPSLDDLEILPPALATWGDVEALRGRTVAIVGTRGASTYGKAVAYKFSEAFARAGVTVISGGALGIDAASHKGALRSGGKTAAILATGVDGVYPHAHGGLFREIRESGGVLVSAYAFGSRLADYKFLHRNVLIAALSDAVLVVEAPTRSGALRTASAAAELGREVFVVPANVDARGFGGSFGLLRDGATLAVHPDDVLESLDLQAAPAAAADAPESRLLAAMSSEAMLPEQLVVATGMDPSDILAELTMLELDGRVIRDGGRYALVP